MIEVENHGRSITINGQEHSFKWLVEEMVVLEDRVIVRFLTDDYDVGDPLVGENIECYGADGEMLWRIKPTGIIVNSSYGGTTPESFCYLGQDRTTGEIIVAIWSGYELTLDPETGEYSNPVYIK